MNLAKFRPNDYPPKKKPPVPILVSTQGAYSTDLKLYKLYAITSHTAPSRNNGSRPWPGFGRPSGQAWKTANKQIDRTPGPGGQNTLDRQ